MAIEFRCEGCKKLLRVADSAAGVQSNCPGCGAALTVPAPGAAVPTFLPGSSVPAPREGVASRGPGASGAKIEFRCTSCQRLLRVPNSAAGIQSSCPGCGAPLTVPGGGPAAHDTLFDGSVPDPLTASFGPPKVAEVEAPCRPPLPQSYATAGYGASSYSRERRSNRRSGPPWESVGMSILTLVMTIYQIYRSPIRFYSTMQLENSYGPPLIFFLITKSAVTIVTFLYGPGRQAIQRLGVPDHPIVLVAIALVSVALGLYIGAGFYHVGLLMVGAANESYDVTMRVFAYSGASGIWAFIPVVGPVIEGLATIVFVVIGLAYAHNTRIWRVILGLLMPYLCCFGALIGLSVLVGVARAETTSKDSPTLNVPPAQRQPVGTDRRIPAIDREFCPVAGPVSPFDFGDGERISTQNSRN